MDLFQLQTEVEAWRDKNFPGWSLEDCLFGMMEEMGEIAHAHLKHKQGIRGMTSEVEAVDKMMDGICDFVIFATGVFSKVGRDFQAELEHTWHHVKQRDWVADPIAGEAGQKTDRERAGL
jgi:hypothetical protein